MKKIWIVNQYASTPETGMGGRNFYLARELAKQGHKVYLIASSSNHLLYSQPSLSGDVTFEEVAGFTFVWVKMPDYEGAHSKQRVLNWFLFPWRIQKLAKLIEDKPDAILCSSPSPVAFLGAQRLAKVFSARLVFEVRDIWPLTLTEVGGYSPKHPFIRLMQWVENKAYRDADHVVSNLKNSIEHMMRHGLNRDEFTWISNGFSIDEVSNPLLLDGNILEKLPKNSFVVGYTGTFGLANDLHTLIDAAELLKEVEDINFVFVGGGKDKQHLVDYVERKKLNNILILDFVKKQQVQSMLEKFDVLAIGAKKEPMYRFGVSPNKLFDYLYAAKPIVYYIESGDYNPIKNAEVGFEIESGNPKALADAILKIYQLPIKQRQKMGENGRKVALEEYEYGMLAKKLAAVLLESN
ncbi:glycosyltransferase family 4 protein [Marinomonas aquiplantarum]|uniref:Glycosyltransferase involved in cell wall biosynthesis n=1 Tax=Marinomonas aquiplantarum TaxID=491951 RepID=A0A366D6Q9_9GAMM|nr:glycosyltransferase family 4 protein [Marinomonas aquiplantarum]RBO85731.1 glycosyltransferase involved in cell wall biosynthesis [Marinomonas aquiplantarum]